MPKLLGAPYSLTNIQQQREVSDINFRVSFTNAGAPVISATAYGIIRNRDGSGAIILSDPTPQVIGSYTDAQITGSVRTGVLNAIAFLDTQ